MVVRKKNITLIKFHFKNNFIIPIFFFFELFLWTFESLAVVFDTSRDSHLTILSGNV